METTYERLAQSMLLLAEAMPSKFPEPPVTVSTQHLIFPSLQAGLCRAVELRKPAEEISISILAYRNEEFESHSKKRLGCEWEFGVHLSRYLPRPFSTAVTQLSWVRVETSHLPNIPCGWTLAKF